jgi:hypothetical protein
MGMDPKGRVRIPEAQEGIFRSTDRPAFRPGKAYHPPDGRKWLRTRRYSQPVRRFRHSQTGQLLLAKKCSPAEQNYDTYDRELVAILETLRQWRHYLEGANHKILIQCDHKNLEYFQTS